MSMRLVGQASRTKALPEGWNGGRREIVTFIENWEGLAEDWELLPEDVRRSPVPCWEYNGKTVRVGKHTYLKSIGDGYAIRESTGEVYAEDQEATVSDCLYSTDSGSDGSGR